MFIHKCAHNTYLSRRRRQPKSRDQAQVTKPLMADHGGGHVGGGIGGGGGSVGVIPAAPSDPVKMRRLNFQTPGMISHPPIPISQLAEHIERLKSNDNQKFSQEYEVRMSCVSFEQRSVAV